MNNKPLVSVIMNCLNCEQYLNEAIDSVYAQTYENWEIIFWDNDSCDNSKNIAKSYDSRLKYFSSDETCILGKARTMAVQEARGEYLAFLDCDDIWFKDKLKNQMRFFFEGEENLGLVYGSCLLYTSDAADDSLRVDLGGRRIIKKRGRGGVCGPCVVAVLFFRVFFKQNTAYGIGVRLVGSEMCIRDSLKAWENNLNIKKINL